MPRRISSVRSPYEAVDCGALLLLDVNGERYAIGFRGGWRSIPEQFKDHRFGLSFAIRAVDAEQVRTVVRRSMTGLGRQDATHVPSGIPIGTSGSASTPRSSAGSPAWSIPRTSVSTRAGRCGSKDRPGSGSRWTVTGSSHSCAGSPRSARGRFRTTSRSSRRSPRPRRPARAASPRRSPSDPPPTRSRAAVSAFPSSWA
ncbi:hypothetical protein E1287_06660 [Actinomadura sp. KC06]|nr:hypothetical protein E1287_06660 [Actinomadura sp. KC06]